MHAFQTHIVQRWTIFLFPFDIHDNYLLTAKNWSNTYKKSPFWNKERWKIGILFHLEWEYILTPRKEHQSWKIKKRKKTMIRLSCTKKILQKDFKGSLFPFGGAEGTIIGVDICQDKDRKVWRKELKSQDIYLRLLVKPYRLSRPRDQLYFQPVVLRGCLWVTPTGLLCPFPGWSAGWSFLAGRAELPWL